MTTWRGGRELAVEVVVVMVIIVLFHDAWSSTSVPIEPGASFERRLGPREDGGERLARQRGRELRECGGVRGNGGGVREPGEGGDRVDRCRAGPSVGGSGDGLRSGTRGRSGRHYCEFFVI